jgi:hypothetical protein
MRRTNVGKCLKDVIHFPNVRPNLSLMNNPNALAKLLDGLRPKKDTTRTIPEGSDNQVAVGVVQQDDALCAPVFSMSLSYNTQPCARAVLQVDADDRDAGLELRVQDFGEPASCTLFLVVDSPCLHC